MSIDIDLYADFGEVFCPESDESYEKDDLFDDLITNPITHRSGEDHEEEASNNKNYVKYLNNNNSNSEKGSPKIQHQLLQKHQIFIGNLTWWTSDEDIKKNLNAIGVNNIVEIKFFENKISGQSKGFCSLEVGSEESIKIIKQKLLETEIHGKVPILALNAKQALKNFDSQNKGSPPIQADYGNYYNFSPKNGHSGSRIENASQRMNFVQYGPPRMMEQIGLRNSPLMGNEPRPRNIWLDAPFPPPGYRNMGPHQPPSPGNHNFMPSPGYGRPMGPENGMRNCRPPRPLHMMNQGGPPPLGQHNINNMGPLRPTPMSMGPRNPWPLRPPIPQQGFLPNQPLPLMNPAFFTNSNGDHSHGGNQSPVSGVPIPNHGPINQTPRNLAPALAQKINSPGPNVRQMEMEEEKDAQFEEIMGRNRELSSFAIKRAVSEAESGEFGSAIETLVTAISLIKQSKFADNAGCKVIINSLRDTQHGIEDNLYGSKSKGRSRSRSRERCRNRRNRRSSRSRERERSKEKTYRDRIYRNKSQETRFYDERFREKGRERDPERDFSRSKN